MDEDDITYYWETISDCYGNRFCSDYDKILSARMKNGWEPLGAPFKQGSFWVQAMVKKTK